MRTDFVRTLIFRISFLSKSEMFLTLKLESSTSKSFLMFLYGSRGDADFMNFHLTGPTSIFLLELKPLIG